MTDIASKITKRVQSMLQTREAFSKHAQKKSLKEYVSSVTADLRSLRAPLENLVTSSEGVSKRLASLQGNPIAKDYFAYRAAVANSTTDKRAAAAEQAAPFSSLLNALNKYVDMLTEVESMMDGLVTTDAVNLFNCRVSHVMAIGAVEEGKKLYKFTNYLVSGTLSAITGQRDVAKYRHVYMSEQTSAVAGLAVKSYASAGIGSFSGMVKNLKSQANDKPLIDDTHGLMPSSFDFGRIDNNTRGFIALGTSFLSVLRWLGEAWETRKHNRAQAAKKEREWIEAHIALLNMQLSETDPNSEEYKRLAKIVEKYEDMITEDDRKDKGPEETED